MSEEIVGFGLLPPMPITDAVLTSSTVAENDHPAWNGATAYAVGDKCIRTSTHRIYERRVAGTTATAPEADPTNWLEIGPTNKWRMYDRSIGSRTTATGSMVWEMVADRPCTGLWLGDVIGQRIFVEVEDPTEGIVYERERFTTSDSGITDWYAYFFEPIERRRHFLFDDLPPYVGATVRVTVEDAGNPVAVGVCLLGTIRMVGGTRFNPSIGIKDYSKKEADSFGGFSPVEGPYSRRARWSVLVPNAKVDVLDRLLIDYRAEPILYIGSNQYECLQVYGMFRDYEIVIPGPVASDCSLQLEGLTAN